MRWGFAGTEHYVLKAFRVRPARASAILHEPFAPRVLSWDVLPRPNVTAAAAESGGPTDSERAAFIHREFLQLLALMLAAVAAFFLTRAVAANNRDMNLRDAAEWFRRGQQALASGRIDEAVDDFRRATARNRTEKPYVLALARALARGHDQETARGVLLALREATPEDPEINVELARLAAERQDVSEALHFYRNALYAPWTPEQAEARRRVRFELIGFLLAQHQTQTALSELLAVTNGLPDEPAAHLEVARLFTQAGDSTHALEQYQSVLRIAPDDADGLAGAGNSAFELERFALARTYLQRAPDNLDDVATTREVVEQLLSADPLASRLGSSERRRRLASNLTYVDGRLTACLAGRTAGPAMSEESALRVQAEAFQAQLKRTAVLDQDTIESGVDLVTRIARHLAQACGPASPVDRALVILGRQHTGTK